MAPPPHYGSCLAFLSLLIEHFGPFYPCRLASIFVYVGGNERARSDSVDSRGGGCTYVSCMAVVVCPWTLKPPGGEGVCVEARVALFLGGSGRSSRTV